MANNITVDDTGLSTPGLIIAAVNNQGGALDAVALGANAGVLAINSSGSILLTATDPTTPSALDFDGDGGVNITAAQYLTVDQNLTLSNPYSSGSWTVSATAAYLNANASIQLQNNATISFTVSSTSGINQNYPQGLDLSQTNPALTILSAGGLTVATGAFISSSSNIVVNTVPYIGPVGPGLYGAAPYSVTIATDNGPLQITPTTLVTPAEWVAANQVVYTAGQTLNIGVNNNATGGNFALADANVPFGGFNSIVIPNTSNTILMNVSTASVPTTLFSNNGTVAASGAQSNLTITGVGTVTGNLEVNGTGTL